MMLTKPIAHASWLEETKVKGNISPSGTPLALVAPGCYDGDMASSAPLPALDPAFAAAFRNGTLTERQAEQFVRQGAAAVAFQLLELSAWIESGRLPLVGPHTPSGAIPPYAKPVVEPEKPKKRGAKPGHPGKARPAARAASNSSAPWWASRA